MAIDMDTDLDLLDTSGIYEYAQLYDTLSIFSCTFIDNKEMKILCKFLIRLKKYFVFYYIHSSTSFCLVLSIRRQYFIC